MEPYCCAWAVHIRVVWSGTSRLRPSSVSSPSARAPRFAAMAGRMPAAASRRSRSRGPNSGPAGRPSSDATPRSPLASPTPSGHRGRAAQRRTPASSPPGIAPSGSCGGGVRYLCTASAYHHPRPRRRLQHPIPARHAPRAAPNCIPKSRLDALIEAVRRTFERRGTRLPLDTPAGLTETLRQSQLLQRKRSGTTLLPSLSRR